MPEQYVTENYMESGGDRWILKGTMDREGAPVLPVATLQAQLIQHYQVAPVAVSATAIHAAVTLADGEVTEVTDEITNPDVPRVLAVKGNAAGITGDVVIEGTNILDEEVTDTIALSGTSSVNGVVAFKTVTGITFPARNAEADTVTVGTNKLIGIPHIVLNAACLLVKLFNGSADSGSLTVDADEVEKNFFTMNGVPDGAKLLDLFYLV
jgi:hypothetical protein